MDTSNRKHLLMGSALCVAGVVLISTVPVISRYAIHDRKMDPMMFIGIWLTSAGFMSVLFRSRGDHNPPLSIKKHWRWLLAAGVVHLVTAVTGFTSVKWISASMYGFIFSITIPITFVLGWLVQAERVGRLQLVGLASAGAGLVLFLWRDDSGQVHWLGVILVLICAATASIIDLIVKRKPNDLPLWALVAARASMAGWLMLFISMTVRPRAWPETDLFIVLMIGAAMGPFLGYHLIFKSYHYLPLTVTAVIRAMTPVISAAYAIILIGESLHWAQLPGAALIVMGAAIAPINKRKGDS